MIKPQCSLFCVAVMHSCYCNNVVTSDKLWHRDWTCWCLLFGLVGLRPWISSPDQPRSQTLPSCFRSSYFCPLWLRHSEQKEIRSRGLGKSYIPRSAFPYFCWLWTYKSTKSGRNSLALELVCLLVVLCLQRQLLHHSAVPPTPYGLT